MSAPPPFNYGGQAVIEGVMMRGSRGLSVAVRSPGGDIVLHTEPLNARIYGGRLARLPFVRGLTLLWDALGLGIKSLLFSAEVAMQEEAELPAGAWEPALDEPALDEPALDEPALGEPALGEPGSSQAPLVELPAEDSAAEPAAAAERIFSGPAQWGTVIFSLSFSVALFILLPAFLADRLPYALNWLGLIDFRAGSVAPWVFNLVTNLIEGFVRLALVVGYIWAIGLMPDIRRLYGYHGAEHKTINAFEAGAELSPASVARFPLEHPRCGTAFLLTVVLVSIIFFSVVSALWPALNQPVLRILSRLIFLPVVAGIAYEFIRFTARNQHIDLVRMLTLPNLALQRLTTREPDESMLEVAIAAFQQVLRLEYEADPVAPRPAVSEAV